MQVGQRSLFKRQKFCGRISVQESQLSCTMAEISIFTPFLRSGRRRSGRRAVVLDGGLATELERMGKDLAGVRASSQAPGAQSCVLGVHGYASVTTCNLGYAVQS